jgi:hypothetical protein
VGWRSSMRGSGSRCDYCLLLHDCILISRCLLPTRLSHRPVYSTSPNTSHSLPRFSNNPYNLLDVPSCPLLDSTDFDFRRWRSRLKINSEKLCWQHFSHRNRHKHPSDVLCLSEGSCHNRFKDKFLHSSTSVTFHTARQQYFHKRWNA